MYAPHHRSEWLGKITEAGVRHRAEFYYQQLDALRSLRQQLRRDLLAESGKQSATKLLRQIPHGHKTREVFCQGGRLHASLIYVLIATP